MFVVDSHQHLWDPAVLPLPAVPAGASVLSRAYLPDDLRPEIEAVGVDCTVFIQVCPQSPATNQWMFSQANAAEFVAGVVAWVDLKNPSAVGSALDELQKEPKFVGLRHLVEDECDVDWIVRGPVLESLRECARRDVPYDMLVRPQHLKNVLRVLDEVPRLRMVVDHLAKPDIAGGGSAGWAEDMAAIAGRPQAHCKLSGMITEADWHNWRATDLAPYVHHVIDVFGWDRVMFGSDWPVCLVAGDYAQVWSAINEVLRDASDERRAKVFGSNAIRFYGLRI